MPPSPVFVLGSLPEDSAGEHVCSVPGSVGVVFMLCLLYLVSKALPLQSPGIISLHWCEGRHHVCSTCHTDLFSVPWESGGEDRKTIFRHILMTIKDENKMVPFELLWGILLFPSNHGYGGPGNEHYTERLDGLDCHTWLSWMDSPNPI